ncbi:MAG: tetratricopeptide repeat protein, partial [Pseudomonadota bacterium]
MQLRPTTARLLGAILSAAEAHPAGVQTKDALIASVWPRGQASEQSLFQAISELRRALAPLEAVTTVPNQGYRFDLTVTRANARSWPRLSMVASVVLMAVVVLVGQGGPATGAPHDAAISPSLSAFARGVALLENQRPAEAEAVFRAVLMETPSFADARVLLGEAILAQGRLDDARDYAASLLRDPAELDPLSGVSALALMSRAQERAGREGEAL